MFGPPGFDITALYTITPDDIIVVDRDVGTLTDSLTCDILPTDGFQFFAIDQVGPVTTLQPCDNLYVQDIIDVDTFPHYEQINLTLRVRDTGTNNIGALAELYITVYDINDQIPIFVTTMFQEDIYGRHLSNR